jgi:hypothetical protein
MMTSTIRRSAGLAWKFLPLEQLSALFVMT